MLIQEVVQEAEASSKATNMDAPQTSPDTETGTTTPTTRATPEILERLKPRLWEMYMEQGRPLSNVRRELENEGITMQTDKPLKLRFQQWGWRKRDPYTRSVGRRRAPIQSTHRVIGPPVGIPSRRVQGRRDERPMSVSLRFDAGRNAMPKALPVRPSEIFRAQISSGPPQMPSGRMEPPPIPVKRPDPIQAMFNSLMQDSVRDMPAGGAFSNPAMSTSNFELPMPMPSGGAFFDWPDNMSWTSNYEITMLLLESDDTPSRQPLHLAAKNGHLTVVLYLLRRGDFIDEPNDQGQTPLWLAAHEGHVAVVQALLAQGADPNVRSIEDKRHALHQAAGGGHSSVVQALVGRVDDIDMPAKNGETPLCLAAQSGDRECVQMLIGRGANPITPMASGHAPLHQAAQKGHSGVVRTLLNQIPHDRLVDVDAKTADGMTPLWYAAQSGDAKSVTMLLQRGANCNVTTKKEGRGPLHQAITNKHVEVAKILIKAGSDVNAAAFDGSTPLLIAAETELEEVIELLVQKNANLNAVKRASMLSALHIAAQNGSLKIVALLVAKGAHINVKDSNDETALFRAAKKGHHMVVRALLSADADPNVLTADKGRHALHEAAEDNAREIVDILLASSCDVNCVDFEGATPLWLAVENDDRPMVANLLSKGADPNRGQKGGLRALHQAIFNESPEILEMLIKASAQLETLESLGCMPLHLAASSGDFRSVVLLLNCDIDVNCMSLCEGRTPLHYAAFKGSREIITALLKRGAMADIKDFDGVTPLIVAAQEGNLAAAELLLLARANPAVTTLDSNRQALHQSAQNGHTATVYKLGEHLTDFNPFDIDGETPLFIAARNGHTDIVAFLLSKGANPNARLEGCETVSPLGVAAQFGYEAIVQQLLRAGAVVDDVSAHSITPLRGAAESGHATVVQLLLDAGAKTDLSADTGRHALHQAAQEGHYDVVAKLLAKGAPVDPADRDGVTPLLLAVQNGCVRSTEALLKHGADPNARSISDGVSAIFVAAAIGSLAIVDLLIQWKANVNVIRNDSVPAIMLACEEGYRAIVQSLLDAGADPNIRSNDLGRNSLHRAAQYKHGETVRCILASGKMHHVDAADDNGATALYFAAESGDRVAFRELLKMGANPNVYVKSTHARPIHHAAMRGYMDILSALLNQDDCDVNVTTANGRTALFFACGNGHDKAVKLLLSKGANPELGVRQARRRGIHQAAECKHTKVVELLIKEGAEIDPRDNDEHTPLLLAAANGDHESVAALLRAGASPNAYETTNQRRALHMAAAGGFTSAVKKLLEYTTEIDVVAKENETPLWLALRSGDAESARALLRLRAKAHVVEKTTGLYALHLAAQKGFLDIARTLLQQGAMVNCTTPEDATPLMLACEEGHLAIVELLLEWHANISLSNKNGGVATTIAAEKGHLDILRRLTEEFDIPFDMN